MSVSQNIKEKVNELMDKYYSAEDAYIGYCEECKAAGEETNSQILWQLSKSIAFEF